MRISLLTIFFLLIVQLLISQSFIQPNSFDPSLFSSSETQRLNNIINRDFIETDQLISVNQVKDYWDNGELSFNLPGLEAIQLAETSKYEETSNGYHWMATLNDNAGHIILRSENGFTAGTINTGTEFFSIEPLKSGVSILLKHDTSMDHFGIETCATDNSTSSEGNSEPEDYCDIPDEVCASTINIGILLTPEAINYMNNPELSPLYFDVGLSTVEMAFWNSGIYNKSINYQIFSVEFPYSLTENIEVDLDILETTIGQEIRFANELDIIVLLTNDRYSGPNSPLSTTGIASGIGENFTKAYSITSVEHLLSPRYTFAHELGHLFGARHSRSSNGGNDNEDICAHGFRFFTPSNQYERTIMAFAGAVPQANSQNKSRVLHYSNPDVEYDGAATGTPEDNNALFIGNSTCVIGTWWSGNELLVGMVGPNVVCEESEETFYADVTAPEPGIPGQGPFTYEWHWNTTGYFGQNSNAILISSESNVDIGLLACPRFYLSLTVVSADGVVRRVVRKINTKKCEGCKPEIDYPDHRLSQYSDIEIYPNPTNNIVNIDFPINEMGIFNISIQGLENKKFIEENIELGKGQNIYQFDMEDFSSGIYFITINSKNFQKTFKIIKV